MHFKLCNLVLAWKNNKNINLKEKITVLGRRKEEIHSQYGVAVLIHGQEQVAPLNGKQSLSISWLV